MSAIRTYHTAFADRGWLEMGRGLVSWHYKPRQLS